MIRSSEIEGNYRYLLHIPVSDEGKKILFLMCNPSTADLYKEDTTTRNLKKWAKQNGVGVIIVGNIYAYRTSRPEALQSLKVAEAVGEKNIDAIIRASSEADEVIIAWGDPPKSRPIFEFNKLKNEILEIIKKKHSNVYRIGTKTKSGQPRHPRTWYMRDDREKTVHH